MKNVIFDLDLTLVDTTCLENARHARNWGEAYRLIPQTNLYDGIGSVLDIIKKNNINTTIVSSSPRSYVEKIVNYYDIPAKWIVSYHDAKPIKPHPAQMLMALQLMQVSAKDTISFGDRATTSLHPTQRGLRVLLVCGEQKNGALYFPHLTITSL